MTARPCRSATSRMRSQSGAFPARFGIRIAFVAGPIIASIASTSTLNVSGSTSTNTGTSPARMSGARSVENVSGDVMTSDPGGRSSSSTARYSADEPELHITPPALPNSSATRRSISATFLPMRSVPAPSFSTPRTASISSWSYTAVAYRTRRSVTDPPDLRNFLC